MSRSRNELLLIALALFVMAATALYSVFNPTSLKALEMENREVNQTVYYQTVPDSVKAENSEADGNILATENVETAGQISDSQTSVQTGSVQAGFININSASLSQLMTLDGIGETKAQAIIDYREEHGGFASTQEITSVKGIGEKIFEKIKNYICV